MTDTPVLSIGIPLYRAAPHYDTIVSNIEGVDYPHVEFLISDRHRDDDTIARLSERYRTDSRVSVFEHDDRLGWEHNYNFLLRQASGKYFRWLPQDDLLPRTGLEKLVECLDANPEVILAYPQLEIIDAAGVVVRRGGHDVRYERRGRRRPWNYLDALGVAARLHHGSASAGIFRREPVLAAGLAIRPVSGGLAGTAAFRYGLACRGRFKMLPGVVAQYRWHSGNYTVYSPKSPLRHWRYFRVAKSFTPRKEPVAVRAAQDIGLLIATTILAPAIAAVWAFTPQGRQAQRIMQTPVR